VVSCPGVVRERWAREAEGGLSALVQSLVGVMRAWPTHVGIQEDACTLAQAALATCHGVSDICS
jgi:hypothetical protein